MASTGKSETGKRPKAVRVTASKEALDDAGVYINILTDFAEILQRQGALLRILPHSGTGRKEKGRGREMGLSIAARLFGKHRELRIGKDL